MSTSILKERQEAALRWRKTKIIATLGPASSSLETIIQLIESGVDAFRLNMSHSDHQTHRLAVERVREASAHCQKHIAIIMDLCGPKIRVGMFEEDQIELQEGEKVVVTCRDVMGKPGLIPSQYAELYKDIKPGERILLDDGNLELKALQVEATEICCEVVHGGILKNKKGMNLPDSNLTTPSFTEKDCQDAQLAIELKADFLALSFVRNSDDVIQLKDFIKQYDSDIEIISKIEKPEAVSNIESILEHSYAIMVARGDLGIEIPAERVPLLQQELIELGRHYNRPVIVATQMLESMITNSRPTRAEVGDVANAALSSTDAVMLSGETAAGKYPLLAVQTMDRVLREIEAHQWQNDSFSGKGDGIEGSEVIMPIREAVASATLNLAKTLKLQGIVIPTRTGTTARIISTSRPSAPCIGVCSDERVNQKLALSWGVIPVLVDEPDTHNWRQLCSTINNKVYLTQNGHTVLIVSGFHEIQELSEPVLKILTI